MAVTNLHHLTGHDRLVVRWKHRDPDDVARSLVAGKPVLEAPRSLPDVVGGRVPPTSQSDCASLPNRRPLVRALGCALIRRRVPGVKAAQVLRPVTT